MATLSVPSVVGEDASYSRPSAQSPVGSNGPDDKYEADATLVQWIRDRISLPGFKSSMWLHEHYMVVADFIVNKNVNKLIIYIDGDLGLSVNTLNVAVLDRVHRLQYFIKAKDNVEVTASNISSVVQYGIISGTAMDSLLKIMNGVYLPTFLGSESWPESVKKEFSGQLHKFMASLTETANQEKGHTILYVPDENLGDLDTAAQDKDLVQRLESTLIHWTRQIKEVVSNQENSHHVDYSGPLEEIAFWHSRTVDLSGIRQQLERAGVKNIVRVLELANSTYLKPFTVPRDMIEQGSIEAQNNLKFLSTLQEPCEKLASAEPAQIPAILPHILNRIRMISTISKYYRSEERLSGLLRKVSNQIIVQCSKKINLTEIFDGIVDTTMVQLKESIFCGEEWKRIYHRVAATIAKFDAPDRRWTFDPSSIFAQVDAFVQRCRDLLEVCEGQLQFARRTPGLPTGQRAELPVFGGSKGADVEKSLYEIEEAFKKHIERLRGLEYNILDVKATKWHDDYNYFKNGMRDLEVMMTNVIASAWEGVSTVSDGVSLLESFYHLAKRSAMKLSVERKTAQVYAMFNDVLRAVRAEFDRHRKSPPLPQNLPQYAGAGIWAHGLLSRIRADMKVLNEAPYLTATAEAEDAKANFVALEGVLEAYIRQRHLEWTESLRTQDQNSLAARLEKPLLAHASDKENQPQVEIMQRNTLFSRNTTGQLECNFDKELLRLFNEVRYWEKLGGDYPIPYIALEMNGQREALRVVRENVMLVVRDYNTIISALTVEERRLFHEHMRQIDRKISPGLQKLNWANKHIKDYFVKGCREQCRSVYDIVLKYKQNDELINENCRRIANTLLVDIEKNVVYEDSVFEQKQIRHHEHVKQKLQEAHSAIIRTMEDSHKFFADHPTLVQNQWIKYVKKIDKKVEDALRSTVKRSLQELSRAINGDAKSGGPHALFKVNMVLDEVKGKVEFRPSMQDLSEMVKQISRLATTCIQVVPRLTEVLASARMVTDQEVKFNAAEDVKRPDSQQQQSEEPASEEGRIVEKLVEEKAPSFYDVVSNDDDILKIYLAITHGTTHNVAAELGKIISHYDRYQPIWNMDKVAFIRRYASTQRPLSSFDMDITRYKNHQQDIQSEDPTHSIKFIRIDCTALKQSLVTHCQQWQLKLTTLLHNLSTQELYELHEHFTTHVVKLQQRPDNIDRLGESITLLRELQAGQPTLEGRFEPLEDKFRCLDKFDVHVSDEEKELLERLRQEYTEYQTALKEAETVLNKCKSDMKKDLEESLGSFNGHVAETRSEFTEKAPTTAPGPGQGEPDIAGAFAFINEFRQKIAENRTKAKSMKVGLEIFKIDQPDYKEIEDTEKELEQLEKLWVLVREWHSHWNAWKNGKFSDLDPAELDRHASSYAKQLAKSSRLVKGWKAWNSLSEHVQRFRQMMPLITDLRNPAMRDRHWEQLMDEIQQIFNPNAPDFTLEKLFALGIHEHTEAIANLSAIANRELAIEKALDEIKSTWQLMKLDLVPHKEKYFKVRSTEELFDSLENHQLTLAGMKNSPYYVTFSKDINYWVRTLNEVAEIVEMMQLVQRQWIYLESIFMDSADIRKQLPAESTVFESVNKSWTEISGGMASDPHVLKCLLVDGLLDQFSRMNDKLDRIQHQLDQYLEKKRQAFPRFYFLSNDDLLEILGQSKDPGQVQKHIHKCFAGIKTLNLVAPEQNGTTHYEVVGMRAADGEDVRFAYSIVVAGPVEVWLRDVETAMRDTLRKLLQGALQFVQKASHKKDTWIKNTVGQLVITSGQIGWTAECHRALSEMHKNRKALRSLKSKWHEYLNRLAHYVRGNLSDIDRLKLVSLITIEVHARDVIDRLKNYAKGGVTSFEWISQLRFYYDRDEGDYGECVVKQTNTSFRYGYEYQGNNGRLVITPLTDRCYMTLTTALNLCRGGSPQGPAGTGKTETVKDLGKALGKFVVVFNCSEKMGVESLGRNFSGLAQTGAWGCFDEFNRIRIEVLSVVALQIGSILNAIQQRLDMFNFEGQSIRLDPTVGLFVTMNPGYAGRTELPDNLKSLFRPVAMMVPDSQLIAEIMLQSEGFKEAQALSKKMITLYRLMDQKLSKQDHYDYGLRAVKSVLTRAGALVRSTGSGSNEEQTSEEMVLMRAIRDMNLGKLVADDVPLFEGLLRDLFPNLELTPPDYGELTKEIESQLRAEGLQVHPAQVKKIIQLYDTLNTRHGNMLVGQTLGGKTTVWRILKKALTALSKRDVPRFHAVETFILNPKSVNTDELYGNYDPNTREWTDGILSSMMRKACEGGDNSTSKWLLLDGPVDTLWIESMNTVLDDNKVLTLVNGDRIAMPPNVSLLFEVQDLAVASPATVSRCGMVYVDAADLGWRPFVQSWLVQREKLNPPTKRADGKEANEEVELLRKLFDKYAAPLLEFKARECHEPIPVTDFNAIRSLCRLYDSLATPENGVVASAEENNLVSYLRMVELYFVFSTIWSVGAAVDEKSRLKIDHFVRDVEAQFPPLNTVYEYYVDSTKKDWVLWDEKVNKQWKPPVGMPFHQMLVPTIDTVRHSYLLQSLMRDRRPVLVVGQTGTGKTTVVSSVLSSLDAAKDVALTINFSSASTSGALQEVLESRLEKRQRNNYGPIGARSRLVVFIDDLNMPAKDEYGSQPPIELLKQWTDYSFWYDRHKQFKKVILDTQLVAAMGPPGGSRSALSQRFQSRFNLINFNFPEDSQIRRIFQTILSDKLHAFEEEIKPLADTITQATLELYKQVSEEFLPTPAKCHYLFNMRDMSNVIKGVMNSDPKFFDTTDSMIRLWVHESLRVFHDRLSDDSDRLRFMEVVNSKLQSLFETSWKKLFADPDYSKAPLFGGFSDDGRIVDDENKHGAALAARPYQEVTDWAELRKFISDKLEVYNMDPDHVPMDLVLFRKAMEHVSRIHRTLSQPRGSAMLIGMGGSGRQSLTRLAAFMADQKVFRIEPSKSYRKVDFYEDLKKLYVKTGVERQPTVFLFSDTQLVQESFLEDINNILTSGEVPGLFPIEELNPILEQIRPEAQKEGRSLTQDALYEYFIQRVRDHLHIVLCMSPVGDKFRNRCRMYPALVNCTTMDWFSDWPKEALLEVAAKFLSQLSGVDEKQKEALAQMFGEVHSAAVECSEQMLLELKRPNYTTPTKYLDLVKGYRSLLDEKRQRVGELAAKLRNGLEKLDQSRAQVTAMTAELEVKKKVVAQKKNDCDKLLVEIVQKQREADEQKKQVEQDTVRIEEDTKECHVIRAEAQTDLEKVLPALQNAIDALERLSKNAVTEVKSYAKPPAQVERVMAAVMTILKKEPTWAQAKKELNEPNFLQKLKTFDKDKISNNTLKQISKFTKQKDFNAEAITSVSAAAGAMCEWVIAMEMYANVFRDVEPRRKALQDAEERLQKKQEDLAVARTQLKEITDKVAKLQERFEASDAEKNKLRKEADGLEIKLNRAAKLVDGLSGERVRWEATVQEYNRDLQNLVGDCALAAAFLSYAGPFPSTYRDTLVQQHWLPTARKLALPHSEEFSFSKFLADATDVRDWNIQGLPCDNFSIENGVLVTRGNRYPLMIDPQGQANKWIKAREKRLVVVDLKSDGFLREVEAAIQFGTPVLIQDVGEELDASLEPILRLTRMREDRVQSIRLGDKEINFSSEFMLYMTTKLVNPHYEPEVSIRTTVVNFAVKEKGLEDQLLGMVVRMEEPKLEEDKGRLVLAVAAGKRRLVELEDEILSLLKRAGPDLLDDEVLINALQSSKSTAEEVKSQLRISEQTEQKIDQAREVYRPCARRAALIYFVLNDLGLIDPMYQFSLESYIDLFAMSIENSRITNKTRASKSTGLSSTAAAGAGGSHNAGGHKQPDRIATLNNWHTEAVYNYTCRALFEKHKLLFAFQLCMRKLLSEDKVNQQEYDFFLRGATALDRSSKPVNPCVEWLPDAAWDHICELDQLPAFRNIASSFEQNSDEWRDWYRSETPPPEQLKPVGEWQNKWDEFQQMVLLRCLRPDRVVFAARAFIAKHLGQQFVEPPAFNLKAMLDMSRAETPLIFVLSPGVDPSPMLMALAAEQHQHVEQVALGQGQTPLAEQMIKTAAKQGHWVYLANVHLSISWMPRLEKLLDQYVRSAEASVHPAFRLWLSSDPDPKFPIGLLQSSVKITTEPPRGLKANLARLYDNMTEEQFERCKKPQKYKKLLFSLCFFHAVLVERRKFLTLGWNVPYDFNDSDFSVCENLLRIYLDEYEETPWDALKYLIAEANYGGRVTDTLDRRLLVVYINRFFNEEALTVPNYALSSLETYQIPQDGSLDSYKKYIAALPGAGADRPEAFGQNSNADIASQMQDTNILLDTILSLQPRLVQKGVRSRSDIVLELLGQLQEQIPHELDLPAITKKFQHDQSPLKTVLLQEVARYNQLLATVHRSLQDLSRGIKGLVVISPELEQVFESLFAGKVPALWQSAYPSMKPLGPWARDLVERIDQLRQWANEAAPKVFWLSGFTFPTGFLTALMQTTARKNGVPIDNLTWEFVIINQDERSITQYPKEGAYVRGVFLEGARWDLGDGSLAEPMPMELYSRMPIIHFKPVEARKKNTKGMYSCPLYLYPIRTGTRERPSFITNVDVKAGSKDSDFWVKRGTAMLLSLAQ